MKSIYLVLFIVFSVKAVLSPETFLGAMNDSYPGSTDKAKEQIKAMATAGYFSFGEDRKKPSKRGLLANIFPNNAAFEALEKQHPGTAVDLTGVSANYKPVLAGVQQDPRTAGLAFAKLGDKGYPAEVVVQQLVNTIGKEETIAAIKQLNTNLIAAVG